MKFINWSKFLSCIMAFVMMMMCAVPAFAAETSDEEMHYGCVHNYATRALQHAPHAEDLYFWMIRSLMRVGHSEVARGELRMAQTKLLDEEYSALVDRLKEVGDMP